MASRDDGPVSGQAGNLAASLPGLVQALGSDATHAFRERAARMSIRMEALEVVTGGGGDARAARAASRTAGWSPRSGTARTAVGVASLPGGACVEVETVLGLG